MNREDFEKSIMIEDIKKPRLLNYSDRVWVCISPIILTFMASFIVGSRAYSSGVMENISFLLCVLILCIVLMYELCYLNIQEMRMQR